MKVTLLQQDIIWANPQQNREAAEKAIAVSERSDLYVLPEMFSTGFAVHPEGIAESNDDTLRWMQQMAQRMDAAMAGSVAVDDVDAVTGEHRYYNRFYFVTPDGVEYYDKRHLFTYGGEHLCYCAGNGRVVVEWRGVRFMLLVCYDLRFPVWSRNSIADPYDVMLYVASWPDSRRAVWDTLLKARAIENQCYVCGVNRVGNDPQCSYSGGTVAIDAYGRVVAQCEDGAVSSLSFDVDIQRLCTFRKKFPVLADGDSFSLGL